MRKLELFTLVQESCNFLYTHAQAIGLKSCSL